MVKRGEGGGNGVNKWVDFDETKPMKRESECECE